MIVIFLLLSSFTPSPFPSDVLAERLLYEYITLLRVVFSGYDLTLTSEIVTN